MRGRTLAFAVGARFGRLVVLGFENGSRGRWRLRCDCGKEITQIGSILTKGQVRSCGCLKRDIHSKMAADRNFRHGYAAHQRSPIYQSWIGMVNRCTNPNNQSWKHYGGRGIVVCQRWREFNNFLVDMGPRPEGRTLDRIDNDGNYEPGNCRWATPSEQSKNRRPAQRLKLKPHQLIQIRWLAESGLQTRYIAEHMGISHTHVCGLLKQMRDNAPVQTKSTEDERVDTAIAQAEVAGI